MRCLAAPLPLLEGWYRRHYAARETHDNLQDVRRIDENNCSDKFIRMV